MSLPLYSNPESRLLSDFNLCSKKKYKCIIFRKYNVITSVFISFGIRGERKVLHIARGYGLEIFTDHLLFSHCK